MFAFLLLACAPAADTPAADATPKSERLLAETDLRPAAHGTWPLGPDARLELQDGALYLRRSNLRELVHVEVIGTPAVAGGRAALAHRGASGVASTLETLALEEGALRRRVVADDGAPDRVALSADGAWMAWVSGESGIASVYAQRFEGGEVTQLTNVDLVYTPGQPPEGFTPPPHRGPLEIVDGEVRWHAPEGPQQAALP